MAVLTSTHNLCFEQKYEKYQNLLSEICHFVLVKFSVYLNRRVFVMSTDRSKAVSLLQFFFVRASVVSYVAFVLPITKTCLFRYIENFTTKK